MSPPPQTLTELYSIPSPNHTTPSLQHYGTAILLLPRFIIPILFIWSFIPSSLLLSHSLPLFPSWFFKGFFLAFLSLFVLVPLITLISCVMKTPRSEDCSDPHYDKTAYVTELGKEGARGEKDCREVQPFHDVSWEEVTQRRIEAWQKRT